MDLHVEGQASAWLSNSCEENSHLAVSNNICIDIESFVIAELNEENKMAAGQDWKSAAAVMPTPGSFLQEIPQSLLTPGQVGLGWWARTLAFNLLGRKHGDLVVALQEKPAWHPLEITNDHEWQTAWASKLSYMELSNKELNSFLSRLQQCDSLFDHLLVSFVSKGHLIAS